MIRFKEEGQPLEHDGESYDGMCAKRKRLQPPSDSNDEETSIVEVLEGSTECRISGLEDVV
jgi:hypothetical protein